MSRFHETLLGKPRRNQKNKPKQKARRALLAELLEPRLMCSVSAALQNPWGGLGAPPRAVDDAPNTATGSAPALTLDVNGSGSRTGTLEVKRDRDVFRVDIAASGRFQFDDVAGTLANPCLALLDWRGKTLASDDNSGGGYNSRIVRNMTPGTYYLQASAYRDSLTGTYSLSATRIGDYNVAPTIVGKATAASKNVTGTTVVLGALGADDGGEASLRYTWSATTLPSGATAPTFSANGNNAAKATTATFAKAGSYGFSVTIVDAGGLSTTSTVSVTVKQTLTSVVVTPGSASLTIGATQQFAAAAVDQFGVNMSSQPKFTWTAAAGAISKTGLYTAPGSATTDTVRATGSGKTGSASVTVTGNQGTFQDAELASLFQSLIVDGSINRNDMMQLLRRAGSDNGVVDATELTDLRYILTNAATYRVPGYVQVLAGNIVNGNQANAKYLGQALGNLTAGSSATQMNNLVNKWFLGADHPLTGYTYQSFAGSLFVNGPAYNDSDQGYLGDCYFIASLDAIARSSPAAVQNMFIDNGDNTWTVRYYANGTADYVTVDRYLPTYYNYAVFADVRGTYTNAGNELWMALAEKAYAQWNETGKEGRDGKNSYASIEGGWMQTVCQQALGRASQTYWWLNDSDKQYLVAALAGNKAVTYGSKSNPGDGLVGPHAYMVSSYNPTTDTFQLYNPWGSTHPGPLTYAQLRTNGQCFVVADASGTVPFGTPPGGFGAILAAALQVSAPNEKSADAAPATPSAETPAASPTHPAAVDRVLTAGWDARGDDWNALLLPTGRRVKSAAPSLSLADAALFARHECRG